MRPGRGWLGGSPPTALNPLSPVCSQSPTPALSMTCPGPGPPSSWLPGTGRGPSLRCGGTGGLGARPWASRPPEGQTLAQVREPRTSGGAPKEGHPAPGPWGLSPWASYQSWAGNAPHAPCCARIDANPFPCPWKSSLPGPCHLHWPCSKALDWTLRFFLGGSLVPFPGSCRLTALPSRPALVQLLCGDRRTSCRKLDPYHLQ